MTPAPSPPSPHSPAPPPVAEPFTAPELRRDLDAVHHWAGEFWGSFDGARFFAPLGDAWSPADNVRHLIKSNRPVAMALNVPWPILLLRFGFARSPSRGYSALRASYREALNSGLRAGTYAPSPLPPERQTADERQLVLDRWSRSLTDLAANLDGWSERALDRLRLPHPGLGPLTVREMVLFTLYHNTHHVLGVARRTEQP